MVVYGYIGLFDVISLSLLWKTNLSCRLGRGGYYWRFFGTIREKHFKIQRIAYTFI